MSIKFHVSHLTDAEVFEGFVDGKPVLVVLDPADAKSVRSKLSTSLFTRTVDLPDSARVFYQHQEKTVRTEERFR